MLQTPDFSRGFFRDDTVRTAEREIDIRHQKSVAKACVSNDFFGIEDLLAQGYEDAVYTMLLS
ncbi:hypothetical protein OKW49_001928 [Paraburkholderia youngii]